PEHQNLARSDGHLLAGLRIAADPLPLLANAERAERRQLHGVAAGETRRNLVQHELDELLRFIAREPHLLHDRLGQVRAGQRLSAHVILPRTPLPAGMLDPPADTVNPDLMQAADFTENS